MSYITTMASFSRSRRWNSGQSFCNSALLVLRHNFGSCNNLKPADGSVCRSGSREIVMNILPPAHLSLPRPPPLSLSHVLFILAARQPLLIENFCPPEIVPRSVRLGRTRHQNRTTRGQQVSTKPCRAYISTRAASSAIALVLFTARWVAV